MSSIARSSTTAKIFSFARRCMISSCCARMSSPVTSSSGAVASRRWHSSHPSSALVASSEGSKASPGGRRDGTKAPRPSRFPFLPAGALAAAGGGGADGVPGFFSATGARFRHLAGAVSVPHRPLRCTTQTAQRPRFAFDSVSLATSSACLAAIRSAASDPSTMGAGSESVVARSLAVSGCSRSGGSGIFAGRVAALPLAAFAAGTACFAACNSRVGAALLLGGGTEGAGATARAGAAGLPVARGPTRSHSLAAAVMIAFCIGFVSQELSSLCCVPIFVAT
mmetsp:Transcript_9606/g.39488  ORF Transcript_9606/g.39488 Transcript_9606/m.39488 type:complete len:281 (-) Transcript_9606:1652-2494(-)